MPGITFISTMEGSPWGGSEELWFQAALRLLGRRERVGAIVQGWADEANQIGELERAGCRVVRRFDPGLVGRLRRRVRGDAADYSDRVRNWLTEAAPDRVVISQGGNTDGGIWATECLRRRIPYVLLVQAVNETCPPHPSIRRSLQEAYENAAGCFFVSRANANATARQLAIPLADARVVRNPYNVAFDANPPWPDDDRELRFACVGRLDARCKGQDLIFEVLRMPKWRERAVRVVFFGAGPDESWYRELVALYDLKSVVFGGTVSDLQATWVAHHALLLPSRLEGLPLAVVEAMLCGRPCVVTDVAGNTEVVEDGVTGFVAAAPTISLLDGAMERAWANRADLQAMGLAAAKRIRKLVPADPVGCIVDELDRLPQFGHALEKVPA